jgi:signal transduction histidine kinase
VFSPWVIRVTAPLVIVSLLLLGVGVGAAVYVNQMQRNVSQGLLVNVSSMRAAEEVEILIREMRTQFDHFLLTGNPSDLKASPTFRKETEHWLTVAERYSISPSEKESTSRARRGYQRFLEELDKLSKRELSEPIPPDELRELKGTIRTLIDEVMIKEIQQPIHSYLDFNEVEVEASVAENQQLADRLVYVLLSLGICGCAAGLVAGYAIARGISRSLVQLSVPIRAAAGQLETLVGPVTFASSTDLGQLEGVLHRIAEQIGAVVERLRQSEREVLRAEQLAAVGQMAAGMAHELRNPLTSIKMLVQGALAHETLNPAEHGHGEPTSGLSQRDLRILEEEIIRLEGLLQSFLQFARPPKLEPREVDLRGVVDQATRLVTPRAAQRDIRIEWKAPASPILVSVDSGQLTQVLLNLLLNAVDAVPSGGVVEMVAGWESDGRLRLEVSDNGTGLPAVLGPRIFVPFVTTKETGLGLGLSICKRIVEAHGGSIAAANRPEGGAVFTILLAPSGVRLAGEE